MAFTVPNPTNFPAMDALMFMIQILVQIFLFFAHQALENTKMDPGRDSPDFSTLEAQAVPVNGGIPNLPEEIIVEILARLPVKSLLRFRCVSKSWLALISSQQFIKTHLNSSRQYRNLSNYRIMLTISDPTSDLKHCPLSSLMRELSADACSIDYPEKHLQGAVWHVDSCNGLIFLVLNKKDLFLWNPSTRKSKKLPPVNVDIECISDDYGFCYTECDDDYKVVGIFSTFVSDARVCESMVKIYSLKANSWKRIEDFNSGFPQDHLGKFASGKLHWPSYSELTLDSWWKIVSLDMESEVYGIVEQPNKGEGKFNFTLAVMRECMCVICHGEISADLWVLKEYGVKESWTKVATVPYVDTSKNWYLKTLFLLENGEILLLFGMLFVVYNPKDNSTRIHEINNLESFEEADIYVESLVSPVAHGR